MKLGRLRLWVGGLFLVLLLLVVVAACVPSIPWWVVGTVRGDRFFRGRPTTYWQEELSMPDTMEEVRQALVSGREQAVPVLVQMLQRKDHVCDPIITDILFDTKAAKTAAPELLAIIRDEDNPNRDLVWLLMKKIDPKAADDAMFENRP